MKLDLIPAKTIEWLRQKSEVLEDKDESVAAVKYNGHKGLQTHGCPPTKFTALGTASAAAAAALCERQWRSAPTLAILIAPSPANFTQSSSWRFGTINSSRKWDSLVLDSSSAGTLRLRESTSIFHGRVTVSIIHNAENQKSPHPRSHRPLSQHCFLLWSWSLTYDLELRKWPRRR